MEEKRKNLVEMRQKRILSEVIESLNQSHPSFYYLSTIEVAAQIKKYMHQPGNLSQDDYELVKRLDRKGIQMLLSFHEHARKNG